MCLSSTSSWFLLVTKQHLLLWPTEVGLTDPWGCQPLVSHFVGTQSNNQPRINFAVESSGSTAQQSNPSNPPIPLQPNPFPFPCTNCERSFTSRTGLGVHMRRAHPDELDQMRQRVDIKARWNEEELQLMARKEAELSLQDNIRFMNQELARWFPSRTQEAIKKMRQKTSYRAAVQSILHELAAGPNHQTPITRPETLRAQQHHALDPTSSTSASVPPSQRVDPILEHLLAQPEPRNRSHNYDHLKAIIDQALTSGKDITLNRLSAYLLNIWPPNNRARRVVRQRTNPPRNRRQRRRQEYAATQRNFIKHQGRCIKSILEGPNTSILPPREVMEPFWKNILESSSDASPPSTDASQSLNTIWSPITEEEIAKLRLPLSTSPGPDGITSRKLRAIPSHILTKVLNLVMWCGKLPEQLRSANTIFLPKSANSSDPSDYRPITIPSVVTRQLHSILGKRISSVISLDPRQRAFLPTDGCADNIILVDLLLRHHHLNYVSCYLASLDVSKAFDSVSHEAIFSILESYGFPDDFVNYIKQVYTTSSTRLVAPEWTSAPITPKRGVKQGDPLSPLLFNIIMDRLLRSLPNNIGCYIGSQKTNAIAFADDLLLCASTPQGLQELINTCEAFLTSCGLSLNSAKCKTISIKGQPKQKNTVVEHREFTAANRTMPFLRRGDEWKYLGISLTTDGRSKFLPTEHLAPRLDRLTRAPLKPQQRLHALRTFLIPQLYHKLTLGRVQIGCLNKADRLIRAAVRKWVDLPKDTPIPFFHASIEDGGLGIPSLRWSAPCLRKHRLASLCLPNLEEATIANTFVATEIDKASERLRVDGEELRNRDQINTYWREKLYNSVDGAGLRDARGHKQVHRWLREPSRLLSGRDFINTIKVRINALPTLSRTSRGRSEVNRSCRAGCGVPETLNHVSQQCHRTHACRIDRHNNIVTYLNRGLTSRNFDVSLEPHFRTSEGLRKPDLIAKLGTRATVVDAQVVTDGRSIEEAHRRKASYYATEEITASIKDRLDVTDVQFTTATLNWRGIWSKSSVDDLLALNILSKRDLAIVSTRVAIGTIRSFRIFNASTSTLPQRRGVG